MLSPLLIYITLAVHGTIAVVIIICIQPVSKEPHVLLGTNTQNATKAREKSEVFTPKHVGTPRHRLYMETFQKGGISGVI